MSPSLRPIITSCLSISVTPAITVFLLAAPSNNDTTSAVSTTELEAKMQGGRSDQSILFDSEVIKISVDGDSVEVDGVYRFLCQPEDSTSMALLYPFPFDSLLGGARMVSLKSRVPGNLWRPMMYREIPKRWVARWYLPACRPDTLEVRAVYRQEILTSYARYIVTTTRGWRRPLSHAAFEICLPEGTKPVKFSYPFELKMSESGAYCYKYEAFDFMPDRDIWVQWEIDADEGVTE